MGITPHQFRGGRRAAHHHQIAQGKRWIVIRA
jgi:hypothetical protein